MIWLMLMLILLAIVAVDLLGIITKGDHDEER